MTVNTEAMALSEQWRQEYLQDRYLEHLSADGMEQRIRDITTNILTLGQDGKLSFPPFDKGTGFWMRLFTHILEEFALRSQWVRDGFLKDTPVPKATWPAIPRSVRATAGQHFEPGKCLFKFGKHEHLKQALTEGTIRLASASSLFDPSLNYAIRDDELRFTVQMPARDSWIQQVDERTLEPIGERAGVLGNMSFTHAVPTDYYVSCLSVCFDFRLFDDFEANACLIIHDPKQFIERLLCAGFEKFPSWLAKVDAVDYLDPLRTKPGSVRPFFSKHFRYSYQTELRIVWVPKSRHEKLKPVFVQLRPLNDIAKLIVLPES